MKSKYSHQTGGETKYKLPSSKHCSLSSPSCDLTILLLFLPKTSLLGNYMVNIWALQFTGMILKYSSSISFALVGLLTSAPHHLPRNCIHVQIRTTHKV